MAASGVQPQSDKLIEISDLHVHFRLREGTVKALKGVDLEILRGETLGLVGESGCGKSVTSQAILRIIPQPGYISRGTILLNRRTDGGGTQTVEITKYRDTSTEMKAIRRKEISVIFQEPMSALSPVHTIGNQIIEAIMLHRETTKSEARQDAIRMLDRVGIPKPESRIDSYTFELSGGMRQRAMIAMALVSNPSLLIADEPTTAIDVTIQAQFLDLLKSLQKEMSMSILYITHNMGVIAAVAQRVAVMYWGRIVEKGSADDIFHDPKHPYTRGLINSIPKFDETADRKLWNIEGVVPHPFAEVIGCHFHPRCPHFMVSKCNSATPQLLEISEGHWVGCFLYGDAYA
jgi:peptide/nickel transport system ATP-binding protein